MSRLSETERREQRVRVRMLQDVIMSVSVDYWRRRALDFDNAMPRPGDYQGGAGDQSAVAERLAASAAECRARADELAAERWSDIA